MAEKILVSIIIPVYKVEKYIRRCLMSVCSQTCSSIECIIVNDATPDHSMDIVYEIVSLYSLKIKFVVINHQINRGLSVARNDGVKAATGEYVFFLDSDDELYSENAIETFASYIENYGKADFVLGRCKVIGGESLTHFAEGYYRTESIVTSYLRREWPVIACSKFINRNFFCVNDLWFIPNLYHEDISFSMKLAFSSSVMISMSEYVYSYYIRDNSITTRKVFKNYMDYLQNMEIGFKYLNHKKEIVLPSGLISDYFVQGLFGFFVSAIRNPSLSMTEVSHIISLYKRVCKDTCLSLPANQKYKIEYIFLCALPSWLYKLVRLLYVRK
ncbi:MAG: glycosyltransferase family 2 protein [Bacteroides sp.]